MKQKINNYKLNAKNLKDFRKVKSSIHDNLG